MDLTLISNPLLVSSLLDTGANLSTFLTSIRENSTTVISSGMKRDRKRRRDSIFTNQTAKLDKIEDPRLKEKPISFYPSAKRIGFNYSLDPTWQTF
jgi:hypothetical protein